MSRCIAAATRVGSTGGASGVNVGGIGESLGGVERTASRTSALNSCGSISSVSR